VVIFLKIRLFHSHDGVIHIALYIFAVYWDFGPLLKCLALLGLQNNFIQAVALKRKWANRISTDTYNLVKVDNVATKILRKSYKKHISICDLHYSRKILETQKLSSCYLEKHTSQDIGYF